jgi:hypothetical protein
MQLTLRQQVVRMLYNAQPIDQEDLDEPAETELTRAARNSVANVDQIVEADEEFREADFLASKISEGSKKQLPTNARKKVRKAERQRKAKARKRK